MKNKCDVFIDIINENILPKIDYEALQRSYETADKSYAKGILNHLHEAMIKAYGGGSLNADYSKGMEGDFVVVPGVVQGRKKGQICLALLTLDLTSSGEYWDTQFLCKYGVLPQRDGKLPESIAKPFVESFIPYDYCYTAEIPDDIHVNHDELPDGIKEVLSTFREYTIEL